MSLSRTAANLLINEGSCLNLVDAGHASDDKKPIMHNKRPYFISAICTPLTDDDQLHDLGLEGHLADQWSHGINGVLVAGTMGLLQLLTDDTYQQLCRRSIELSRGRGEILIGAGDASLARTLARIDFLNTLEGVDGVVVLTPYFMQFSQAELVDYYKSIADASRAPVYLYDLPQRTRSKIEVQTVLTLIRHPNIKGIKCSDEIVSTRLLIDAIGDSARVVVAQPLITDVLLRAGISEHLDGMFAINPAFTIAIGKAAAKGDWQLAALSQQRLVDLANLLRTHGVFQAATALLNARGIPGRFAPRPYQMLDQAQRNALALEPTWNTLLRDAVS